MKRGIKTGGRKPGVPNKITGELRKMMEEFVVGNFAGFTQAWLSIEDPKDPVVCKGILKERYWNKAGRVMKFKIQNGFYKKVLN